MVRTPGFDKNGLKKGNWTPEEDWKLIAYVARYGHWNWHQLPKFAGLARSGRSCRLRWLNYLSPNVKKGHFTREEDETIIELVQHLGCRWSIIASQLPGRTDNEIKNRWNSKLKKRFQHNSVSTYEKVKVSNSRNHFLVETMPKGSIIDPFQILRSTSQSTDSCSSTTLLPSSEFLTATNLIATVSNQNLVLEDEFALLDASKEHLREFFSLDDSPVDPIANNIIDPFQILPATSQSIDWCPTSIPSSWSELSIATDHTIVVSNKNLAPEGDFDCLDALEEPMSGIFLLDDSTVDPMPNDMIDLFQILPENSQSTISCPTSPPSFSITTNNNVTIVSNEDLIPEDEFAVLNANEEPINGIFLLNNSLVDQIPMPSNNIVDPFQIIPATSRSTYSSPSSSMSGLSIIEDHNAVVSDKNLVPEDDFASMESYKEPMIKSFWLEEDTPVEPMPNNVIYPTQNLPSTSQSTGSYGSIQCLSELFVSTYRYRATTTSNENLVPEDKDEYALPDTF